LQGSFWLLIINVYSYKVSLIFITVSTSLNTNSKFFDRG